jgi:peptidase M23-like protein
MPTAAGPAPDAAILYSYPIGIPGRPLGDGFYIRDGYAVENTWFNPGWWHTGEDWYVQEGSSVGARVYAVAEGEVVYAGANYPGRVVIVRHTDGLFSMYGHLDPALAVETGQRVARSDFIGTIAAGSNRAPGHLHFEIRAFLTGREVNGAAPRYTYRCGVNCPPGPGYWPIDAPDHPSAVGWRNPTHVLARRAGMPTPAGTPGEVVVATQPVSPSVTLWADPPGEGARPRALGEFTLRPDERFALLDVRAGLEDSQATSTLAYQLWYRIQLPDGRDGWVHAAAPSARETGSDGRPASIRFNFFPSINAPL